MNNFGPEILDNKFYLLIINFHSNDVSLPFLNSFESSIIMDGVRMSREREDTFIVNFGSLIGGKF